LPRERYILIYYFRAAFASGRRHGSSGADGERPGRRIAQPGKQKKEARKGLGLSGRSLFFAQILRVRQMRSGAQSAASAVSSARRLAVLPVAYHLPHYQRDHRDQNGRYYYVCGVGS
jgi:hypothetical protein